jgi:signal transduction histidine kinase
VPDLPKLGRTRLGSWSDVALALALSTGALAEQFLRADSEHPLLAGALIVAVCVPLLARRTHPALATCVAAAVIVAAPDMSGDFPPSTIEVLLPPLLAYSCGAHARTWRGLGAVAVLIAAIQVHVGFSEFPNVEIAIATLPPWWVGRELRLRRGLVAELAGRTRELEAEEEAFIELSVQRERARIARDLHDIVSHHLSLMVIQAGAGRLSEPWQGDVAAERFATIRDAGVQALVEADRLLAMLHADGPAAPRLAALLERAEASGARVEVMPSAPELPPEVEAIAYRVVQEALTNAMKHAPGAAVDIRIALDDSGLHIGVRNDPAPKPSPIAATGSGLGLAGMRERLAALGGGVDAAPETGGGFRVSAWVPLERGAAMAAPGSSRP